MSDAAPKSSRKPRADALRNRAALIAAGQRVFSSGGPDTSLETVAREAGVGIGTLYRHFPARDDLFAAVYRQEVGELVALARAEARGDDPVAALRRWMRAGVHLVATKRGMLAALGPMMDGPSAFFADMRAALVRAVSDLLSAGVASGRVRADVAADDVVRAFLGICYASDAPGWQDTATHLLDIFTDGLRAGPDGRN